MKTIICIWVLITVGFFCRPSAAKPDPTMNDIFFQMPQTMKCTLGIEPMQSLLKYNNYGCYCGLGGSGTAVDGIDKCCQVHDACFGTVDKACGWGTTKFGTYTFTCDQKSASGIRKGTVLCPSSQGTCEYKTCVCDANFANCLAEHSYSEKKSCPS